MFGNKNSTIWGKYDTVLCDLDGVIYEGTDAIVNSVETVNAIISKGIPVGYVTNNSSRKPEAIADQLAGFGIHTAPENVIGSAKTGVDILATLIPAGAYVFVGCGHGIPYPVH
jgi:glycerol 3-phosphatase-2